MKTLTRWTFLLSLLTMLPFISLHAQGVKIPFEEWTVTTGTQNFFYKAATVTDASNNVYVCGATVNSAGNHDILVAKYNSTGVQQWMQQYAGAGGGDDAAQDILVDGSGNVFITGTYYANSTDSNNCITIKYNSSGVQQWAATYNGAGSRNDAGADILLSGTDLIVGGSTYSNSTDKHDFLIIKYNASGVQQWATAWDYNDLNDVGYKLRNGLSGLTLAGAAQSSSTNYQYCVTKFNLSTGAWISTSTTGGNGPIGFNKITGLVTDANDNIYITGGAMNSNYDYYTVKFNSSLTLQWSATYNGSSNLNDVANDVKVDGNGNVYVTGYSYTATQGQDIVTIKYNSSGVQQWIKSYNGEDNGDDEGYALGINSTSEVFVTGVVKQRETNDYYTAKYNPANGNTLWEITYNSPTGGNDKATELVIDNSNAVIVAGQTKLSGAYSYTTVKYIEKSITTPPDTTVNSSGFYYTENLGQLTKSNDKTQIATEVKYYTHTTSPAVYFTNGNVHYGWSKIDTSMSTVDTLYRVSLAYNNALTGGRIRAMSKCSSYEMYIKPQIPGGRVVNNYERLVYPELYSKIDVMYASQGGGVKYYYIIQPNGNPASISWTYSGASSIAVNGMGGLEIRCPWDTLKYKRTIAYQVDAGGNKLSLAWAPTYNLSGSTVSFANVGTYDATKVLVFEVSEAFTCYAYSSNKHLRWSTFYGGNNHDGFNGIKVTNNYQVLCAGYTFGDNFPATVQTSQLFGDMDATITRFTCVPNSGQDGRRMYCAYIGGNDMDYANAVSFDSTATPIVVGYTQSADFPILGGGVKYIQAYDTSGSAFIARITTVQGKQWSTCWGAARTEEFNDIVVINDQKYVVGRGSRYSPYKTKAGAYNPSQPPFTHPPQQVGVIVHFDAQDSLVWATHLGTQINGIDGNATDGIFVTGMVEAARPLPQVALSSSYQDPNGSCDGPTDMLLAKFNGNDTIRWSTYYGGTGYDEGSKLNVDHDGNLYMIGTSWSTDFPCYHTTSVQYYDSTFNGGNGDAVFMRFKTNGGRAWSTYYGSGGGTDGDVGKDVTTDLSGNVYFTGTTFSTNYPSYNLSTSPNLWYGESAGAANITESFIFMVRNSTLQPYWSTYFGGSNNEYGNAIEATGNTYLFSAGETHSPDNSFGLFYAADPTPNANSNNVNEWYSCQSYSPGMGDSYIAQFKINAAPTSVNELGHEEHNMYLYPNPSNNNITLEFELVGNERPLIKVYSSTGQLVYESAENTGQGFMRKTIDVSGLANGIYIVQVRQGDWMANKKLIKQD